MPYSIEQQRWGLKKESVRLTAETSPTTWFAVDPSSEMNYVLKLIQDKTLRGIKVPYPDFPGVKDCTGKVKFPVRAQNIGEFFNSLLGNTSTVEQGGTPAYKTQFNILPTNYQPVTYTIFVDRGVDVQKYAGCAVKKIMLTGTAEGAVEMEADIIGINEAAGSIGSPVYTESGMLEFYQTTIKIGGSTNANIIDWSLDIDNGLFAKFALNQQQYAQDVVAPAKNKVTGKFKIWFESETERNNFLANTTQSYEFSMTGDVISGGYSYNLDILMPKVHYTGYKFAQNKELLTADISFEAVYDTSTTKQLDVSLINLITGY